jgi:hypothetical protein
MHYWVPPWNYEIVDCLTDISVWSRHICTDDVLVMWHLYIWKNENKSILCLYFVCHLELYFPFCNLFFLQWNYMCLGIEPLFDLSIFIAVEKVKGCILYNKVWKDNWTYWNTCQYWWTKLNTKSKNIDIYVAKGGNLCGFIISLIDDYCEKSEN